MKICDESRKKSNKESLDVTESVTSELNPTSSQATESDPLFCHDSKPVSSEIGKTPFLREEPRFWIESKKDFWSFITVAPIDDGIEMMQQLKEKFQEIKRSEQLQVLTVLTKSWSVKKVQQVFGVSEYFPWQSKKPVEESAWHPWSITWTFTTKSCYQLDYTLRRCTTFLMMLLTVWPVVRKFFWAVLLKERWTFLHYITVQKNLQLHSVCLLPTFMGFKQSWKSYCLGSSKKDLHALKFIT